MAVATPVKPQAPKAPVKPQAPQNKGPQAPATKKIVPPQPPSVVDETQAQEADESVTGDEDSGRGRVQHPLIGDQNPEVYPFKVAPADWTRKEHKPLRKKDFVDEVAFHEWRLQAFKDFVADRQADLEAALEDAKSGKTGTRGSLKRFERMADKFAELAAELQAQGIDLTKAIGLDANVLAALTGQK